MIFVLAILIGCLFASGLYMMMRRSIVKLLIGLALISNAANLLIFTSATYLHANGDEPRLIRGRPPLVAEGATAPELPHGDPLAQALVLTAIVISFGVLAFALALVNRAYQMIGTDNIDEMSPEE
jgi:multicomponent Na+:H+ antiporter subunit C